MRSNPHASTALCSLILSIFAMSGASQPILLDVNFGASSSAKIGFAAVGLTTNDYWNGTGPPAAQVTITNLAWADGSSSGVALSITNGDGATALCTSDPMYDSGVCHGLEGQMFIGIANLPPGTYDLYLYGHGPYDNENSYFQLSSGKVNFGALTTSNSNQAWNSDIWQEGLQYIVFRSVQVSAAQPIEIEIQNGFIGSRSGYINGMQIASPLLPFAISAQPASQTVYPGTSSDLFVETVSSAPVTYQWYFNGNPLVGATNSDFPLINVSLTNQGLYNVEVQSDGNTLTSSVASVVAGSLPANPLLNVNFAGTSASKVGFAAVGLTTNDYWNGDTVLSSDSVSVPHLKWSDQSDSGVGVIITGAFQELWTFSSDGMYYDAISADGGTFSVAITNLAPGRYDFYLYGHGPYGNENGVYQLISAGTNYGIQATATSGDWDSAAWQEGLQYVVFRGVGVASGQPVTVNSLFNGGYEPVLNGMQITGPIPPNILSQPSSQTVNAGDAVSFGVGVAGSNPLYYQWFLYGTAIPSATNATLSLTNAVPGNAGVYSVLVTNLAGSAMSSTTMLTVNTFPPSIQTSPQSQVLNAGATVVFNATTSGSPPLDYQWLFNGVVIPGATNSTYSFTNAAIASAGNYSLAVTNPYGSATSSNALLKVNPGPPAFFAQPSSFSCFYGARVGLSSGISGFWPFGYQWQFNGANIVGATNPTLVLSNAQLVNSGQYQVAVTNDFGAVFSSNATLSVGNIAAWGNSAYALTNVPAGLTNAVGIAAGMLHELALQPGGTVIAWGNNQYGQTNVPPGLSNVVAVAAGALHSLALRADGTIIAWGNNGYGQTNAPPGLSNVVAITAGSYHNLVLKSDGSLVAWGNNVDNQTNVPSGLSNVVAIAAGAFHNVALKSDGTVVAWGYNLYGQTNVPLGLSGIRSVAAGQLHSLALRSNGAVVGWGSNTYGQTNTPPGLTNLAAIACGENYNLALRQNGTVLGWGQAADGETNVPPSLASVVLIAGGGNSSMALIGTNHEPVQTPLPIPASGTGSFGISIPSQSGRVYDLEYKNALSDTNWTVLPLAPGTGAPLILTDPAATNTQRFYRVQRW